MAVVVQRMVLADVSGVLFTANPVTGERAEMVVNASYGLGEGIVGGEITPDTFVIDRASRDVTSTTLGPKARMVVADRDPTVPVLHRGVLRHRRADPRVSRCCPQATVVAWRCAGGRRAATGGRIPGVEVRRERVQERSARPCAGRRALDPNWRPCAIT